MAYTYTASPTAPPSPTGTDNYWLDTTNWLEKQWGTPIAAQWNTLASVAGVIGVLDAPPAAAVTSDTAAMSPTFNPLQYGMVDAAPVTPVATDASVMAWYPCLMMYANRESDTLNGLQYADAELACYDGMNSLLASGGVRVQFATFDAGDVNEVAKERVKAEVESGATTNAAPFWFIIRLTQPKE